MQNRTISMWDLNKFKHDKVKYETKFQRDWERERATSYGTLSIKLPVTSC